MRSLAKLYDKTLEWSQHRLAPHYLAAVSFVEASVFPIPPYVMLAPMALARPNKAFKYALIASIASVLGGVVGYLLGMLLFDPLIVPLLRFFNYEVQYQVIATNLQQKGLWAVLVAGFTPVPFKIIAIASGVIRIPIWAFLFGSLFGRSIKFFTIAFLMRVGGVKMEKKIRKIIENLGVVVVLACAGIVFLSVSGCTNPNTTSRVVKPSKDLGVNQISTSYTRHTKDSASNQKKSAKQPESKASITKESLEETWNKVSLGWNNLTKKAQEKFRGTKNIPSKPANKLSNKPAPKQVVKAVAPKSNQVTQTFARKKNSGLKNSMWVWPSEGAVLRTFSVDKKGIDIGGKDGSPISAAKDGEVVYSGNALRGYGNLIIIKHDNNYLTAYAHNRKNFVKEGDKVTRGQRIAEMGRTGSEAVKLHFEVRKQGKPVDPLSVLPQN